MLDNVDCEFKVDGNCELASVLAKQHVPLQEAACKKCIEHDSPRSVNPITCGMALHYLKIGGKEMTQEIGLCLGNKTEGVGEELEKIFSSFKWWLGWIGLSGLLTLDPDKCGCFARRQAMNNDGSIETLKRLENHTNEIIDKFLELKPYLLIKVLKRPLHSLIRRCILLAIKRNDARLSASRINENLCNKHENPPR